MIELHISQIHSFHLVGKKKALESDLDLHHSSAQDTSPQASLVSSSENRDDKSNSQG